MLNFCTLFDSNYITLGLNMYYSLERNCGAFHLYVFAFDDSCYNTLTALGLRNITVVSLAEFEDEELLRVKSSRGRGEYCWTCTPSTILYCIKEFDLDHCTYIDADLYFYQDPKPLMEEMGDKSILITAHRYTPKYDQSFYSGIFCVQYVTFRNNEDGLRVLNWWREACIDWCYARVEDGKFGDQKYLDTWPTQFVGVHQLAHLGGGVAPWNVQQYNFQRIHEGLQGVEKNSGKKFNLIFYHFHGLRFLPNREVDLCEYQLSSQVKELIYKPYLQEIENVKNRLKSQKFNLNLEYNYQVDTSFKGIYRILKRMVKREYQRYKLDQLLS